MSIYYTANLMNNIIILILLIIIASIAVAGAGLIMTMMDRILNKFFKTNFKLKVKNASIYSEDRINQDLVRQEVIDQSRYKTRNW